MASQSAIWWLVSMVAPLGVLSRKEAWLPTKLPARSLHRPVAAAVPCGERDARGRVDESQCAGVGALDDLHPRGHQRRRDRPAPAHREEPARRAGSPPWRDTLNQSSAHSSAPPSVSGVSRLPAYRRPHRAECGELITPPDQEQLHASRTTSAHRRGSRGRYRRQRRRCGDDDKDGPDLSARAIYVGPCQGIVSTWPGWIRSGLAIPLASAMRWYLLPSP